MLPIVDLHGRGSALSVVVQTNAVSVANVPHLNRWNVKKSDYVLSALHLYVAANESVGRFEASLQ